MLEFIFKSGNPQFKTLNPYASALKKVFQENPKKEIKTEEQEGPQKKEAIKNPPSAEEPEADSVRNKKSGTVRLSCGILIATIGMSLKITRRSSSRSRTFAITGVGSPKGRRQ